MNEDIEQKKPPPLDLDRLFSGEMVITAQYRGATLRAHMRKLTSTERLEYMRKIGSMKGFQERDGKVRVITSDENLLANVWVFDLCCTKLEAVNPDGSVQDANVFKSTLEDIAKSAIGQAHINSINVPNASEGPN